MNRFKGYLAMAALASFISAGSAMTSMASTKVTKNTAAWVEEAKKQEEEAKAVRTPTPVWIARALRATS